VTSPDETARPQDDEIYTNAIAAETIKFALEVGEVLGMPAAPPSWAEMAASPYLPLSTSLPFSSGAMVHPEFTGYAGGPEDCCSNSANTGADYCCITQSAVTLLQYPLGVDMADEVKLNDLRYYEPRTRANGFFTGDSIYSIAWLALGNASAALGQWEAAFEHMDCDHFCLFRETLQGGHSNFITGGGGFLQNIIQGWSGIRVDDKALTLSNPTLPPNVTSLKLRSMQYHGIRFSVYFNATAITLSAEAMGLLVSDGMATSLPIPVNDGVTLPLRGGIGSNRLAVTSAQSRDVLHV